VEFNIPPTPTPAPTPTPTPFDDALFISENAPPDLPADHPFPIRVTFRNTGNTEWSWATGYELGVTSDACGLIPAGRVDLSAGEVIAPDASAAFDIMLTVPSDGPCTLGLQMNQQDGGGFFGQPITLSFNIVGAVNNAVMISNTIPSAMAPEQSLGVGITVQNTGTTAWFEGSGHALAVVGTPCMIAPALTAIPPDVVVMPGKSYSFNPWIAAPTDLGPCEIDFQMTETGVEFFGGTLDESVTVEIPANPVRDWSVYE